MMDNCAEKARGPSGEPGNTESMLETLYELWINRDPVYDEEVRELYRQLEECMAGLTEVEIDRIGDIIADLCLAYSKGAFLDGAKMGGALIHEILFEK